MTGCFNPRPPLLAGETQAQRINHDAALVSIHARHYWRARHRLHALANNEVVFQSTPAITGGRDTFWRWLLVTWCRFQSTPAITGGRDPMTEARAQCNAPFQSTPAITGGRDTTELEQERQDCLFQSTPAITGGRDLRASEYRDLIEVSIHARHYWRARPDR